MKDTYCIDEYSGDNVNIDGKSPWLVSTYTKTKVGYEESFCVWCEINNDPKLHVYRQLSVKQTSECFGQVAEIEKSKVKIVSYNPDEQYSTAGSWNTYFQQRGLFCNIDKCTIKDEKCDEDYQSSNIKMMMSQDNL